jgi:enoyl-CoA hydratase/carnithine racemase
MLTYNVNGAVGIVTLVNLPDKAACGRLDILTDFLEQPARKAVIIKVEGEAGEISGAEGFIDVITGAPVPVAAVIQRPCLGAWLKIAQACHFRFAARSALFGLNGKTIRADEAEALGLVDYCAPARTVETRAVDFLSSLTRGRSADLIRAVMQSVRGAFEMPHGAALEQETRLFCDLLSGGRDKGDG